MNGVLKIAIEISNGVEMTDNRGHEITAFVIENYPDSKNFNSIYFEKNGTFFRVSNHELPNRRFMEATNWATLDLAIENGKGHELFHNNNIEVIVKNGGIYKTNLNFNILN